MKSVSQAISVNSVASHVGEHWRAYLEVTKPKVVLLLVFTALAGMALAVPGWLPLQETVFGLLGIGLASGSAAAINHVVDRRCDAIMRRTENRPLPRGELTSTQCLVFASAIGILAMAILVFLVNPLTAVLTFLSLIGYAVVYTMYLKRATPQNIVIGGAAGAMPPVLGWAAVTGSVTFDALLLFLIIFIWTPPHFWALAIHRREDYARVNIPMLPVTHGVHCTRIHILLYTVLLFFISLLPWLSHMSGLLYLVGAIALGAVFLYQTVLMFDDRRERQPIRTFVFSITYLMLLFGLMLVDHYLQLFIGSSVAT
ncbi:MAG: protoheme IX farnesyltransferase [Gammaproteobacteria bacterium]|nr:MAG: protoheme IX farnesyltransferase [Gammaproteobacteria bacterium]PIE36846.1 MAG: protoheme IX farnesyltransferase [Gammaproteobacteria bacterium]